MSTRETLHTLRRLQLLWPVVVNFMKGLIQRWPNKIFRLIIYPSIIPSQDKVGGTISQIPPPPPPPNFHTSHPMGGMERSTPTPLSWIDEREKETPKNENFARSSMSVPVHSFIRRRRRLRHRWSPSSTSHPCWCVDEIFEAEKRRNVGARKWKWWGYVHTCRSHTPRKGKRIEIQYTK